MANGQLSFRNIICVGRNYAEHAKELGNAIPEEPVLFLKPVSSIVASGQAIVLPAQSKRVDHEVEVVVAIGRSGKNVSEKNALSLVSGFAVGIDVTARDLQEKAKEKKLPWAVAKGFDTFAPLSRIVPIAEMPVSHDAIEFNLAVNGTVRQHGMTNQMLFSIPKLIAYISTIFTLAPGDLIFTGTPSGVGPLKSGDQICARLCGGIAELLISVA